LDKVAKVTEVSGGIVNNPNRGVKLRVESDIVDEE